MKKYSVHYLLLVFLIPLSHCQIVLVQKQTLQNIVVDNIDDQYEDQQKIQNHEENGETNSDDRDQFAADQDEEQQGQSKYFIQYYDNLLDNQWLLLQYGQQTDPQHPQQQSYILQTILEAQKEGDQNQQQLFEKLFKQQNHRNVRDVLLSNPIFKGLINQNKQQALGPRLSESEQDIEYSQEDQVEVLQMLVDQDRLGELVLQQMKSDGDFQQQEQLQNRRLLFGQWNGTSWQSNLGDEVKVSELSIPGTHDSAAYSSPQWWNGIIQNIWKTQDLSFESQLNKGIRFFDIRVKCQSGEGIGLFHGTIYLGSFSKATTAFRNFMNKNKNQFLILLIQKEQGNEGPQTCGQKVLNQLDQQTGIPRYCYSCNPEQLPTVGELRGKIWLLQANPGGGNTIYLPGEMQIPTCCSDRIMTDQTQYSIQNYWKGPQNQKKPAIIQVFSHPTSMLRLNFLSQSVSPRMYASIYNKWMESTIKQRRLQQIGVIIADFPSNSLISSIINSNI